MLEEVSSVLRMLDEAYRVFGLTYKMALSTRPESYLGTLEQWDKAEANLKQALDSTGQPWEVCSLYWMCNPLVISKQLTSEWGTLYIMQSRDVLQPCASSFGNGGDAMNDDVIDCMEVDCCI